MYIIHVSTTYAGRLHVYTCNTCLGYIPVLLMLVNAGNRELMHQTVKNGYTAVLHV